MVNLELICNGTSVGKVDFERLYDTSDLVKQAVGWDKSFRGKIYLPVDPNVYRRFDESLRSGIPDWDVLLIMKAEEIMVEVLETYQSPDEVRREMNDLPREVYWNATQEFGTETQVWIEGEENQITLLEGNKRKTIMNLSVLKKYPVTGLVVEEDARPSTNLLNNIFKYCPNIFSVVNYGRYPLPTLSPYVVSLYQENMENFVNMPDMIVEFRSPGSLPEKFNRATLTNLKGLEIAAGDSFERDLRYLEGLTELEVTLVKQDQIRTLVDSCPNLELLTIDMEEGESMSEEDLLYLSERLVNLQDLIIRPLVNVSTEGKEVIEKNLGGLSDSLNYIA